jgi:hypothetical protein
MVVGLVGGWRGVVCVGCIVGVGVMGYGVGGWGRGLAGVGVIGG